MKSAIPSGVKRRAKGQARRRHHRARHGRQQETPQPQLRQGVLHQRQRQLRLLRHRDEQHERRRRHHRWPLRQRRPASSSPTSPSCRPTTTARAPYGTWTAQTLLTTDRLEERRATTTYDAGFAVMNENASSQSLTQVVRRAARSPSTSPRGQSHEGLRLPGRAALQRPDALLVLRRRRPGHLRRQHRPGPGLQHDRRLVRRRLDHRTAALSSVTSFGYTGVKNVLWGPYFGTIIQAVYNTAAVDSLTSEHPARPPLVHEGRPCPFLGEERVRQPVHPAALAVHRVLDRVRLAAHPRASPSGARTRCCRRSRWRTAGGRPGRRSRAATSRRTASNARPRPWCAGLSAQPISACASTVRSCTSACAQASEIARYRSPTTWPSSLDDQRPPAEVLVGEPLRHRGLVGRQPGQPLRHLWQTPVRVEGRRVGRL